VALLTVDTSRVMQRVGKLQIRGRHALPGNPIAVLWLITNVTESTLTDQLLL
jgi:hypothetical protein